MGADSGVAIIGEFKLTAQQGKRSGDSSGRASL